MFLTKSDRRVVHAKRRACRRRNAWSLLRPLRVETLEDRRLLSVGPASDPDLAWATYFGGSGDEPAAGVGVDSAGNVLIAGSTNSMDLPGANNSNHRGQHDAFVAKIDGSGKLVWSTYIGGFGDDQAFGIAVDTAGDAFVTGMTDSTDFAGANNSFRGGTVDAFVAKVAPDGTLAWATYLGGSGDEEGYGIALGPAGNVLVAGCTGSTNLPLAANSAFGKADAFVAKLTGAGNLLWTTYLGGSAADVGNKIAVDNSGNAFVTGHTNSTKFSGGNNAFHGGSYDAFVAKVTAVGAVAWAMDLGGSGYDMGDGVAVDASGNVWATGYSMSSDFAGANNSYHGDEDAFVAKISGTGTLAWASYLGGSGYECGTSIIADGSGNALLAGTTSSTNFGGANNCGNTDVFAAKVTAGGSLAWVTNLGGKGDDYAGGIALDKAGNLLLTGETYSTDFSGANNAINAYGADAFVAKQEMPGAVDLSQSTVTVSPSVIPTGGATTVMLTARDANGNQELGGGLTVKFGLGSGSAGGTISSVIDQENGVYTATFTAIPLGKDTITATINGQPITSLPPTVNVVPGPVSLSQSTVAVSSSTVASGGATTVKLTARDARGNQETSGGLTVVFGLGTGKGGGTFAPVPATDNGDGTYSATFTATTAGPNTITATIGGKAVTSSTPKVTVIPGPYNLSQSAVTVLPSTIPLKGTATVTLTARDASGNRESSGGLVVQFSCSLGSFSATKDNNNGTYTATFTGITAGKAAISATINKQSVTSPAPNITVVGQVSLSNSTVAVSPSTITANNTATVTLTARDANGNQEPSGSLIVKFSCPLGTFGPTKDNNDGTYTATFTGITAGKAAISATINGKPVTSNLPCVVVQTGPVDVSHSTVAVSSSRIALNNSAQVTLTACDSAGNQEPGGGLTVQFSCTLGNFGPVTDNGDGTYTATFTGATAGSAPIIAKIGDKTVTSQPTVIVVGPVSLSQSVVMVPTLPLDQIEINDPVTVTLVACDDNGNQEPSGGLTVHFGLDKGSAGGSFGPVTDFKNGTYIATFLATALGTDMITATIGGEDVTSTPPSFTVVGPPAKLEFTEEPTDTTAGDFITPAVEVTVEDANGEKVTVADGSSMTVTLNQGTFADGQSTESVPVSDGVAKFSLLEIDKAGEQYQLKASDASLPGVNSVDSDKFDINAGSAYQLQFTRQPSITVAGATIKPSVIVTVEDYYGNKVESDESDVDITLSANPGNGTLSGTLSVSVDSGDAEFSDLSIDNPGNGYTLVASNGDLKEAISTLFDILPPPTNSQASNSPSPSAAMLCRSADLSATVASEVAPVGIVSGRTASKAVDPRAVDRIDLPSFVAHETRLLSLGDLNASLDLLMSDHWDVGVRRLLS